MVVAHGIIEHELELDAGEESRWRMENEPVAAGGERLAGKVADPSVLVRRSAGEKLVAAVQLDGDVPRRLPPSGVEDVGRKSRHVGGL